MDEDLKIKQSFAVLNGQAEDLYLRDYVPEVEGTVSPLEFYRDWVSANIPVIFRGAARTWPAVGKWNKDYLREKMGSKLVTVAVTPNGYADAVSNDGKYFMLPDEKQIEFSSFIDALFENEETPEHENSAIMYMQQQNSNLTGEMKDLIGDVPIDIDWATEAFGQNPDAVNFWMGDQRAVTSTHKDPYENLYCVIQGEKTFELNPPTDLPSMPYRVLPVARFKEVKNRQEYKVVPEEPQTFVRWICPEPSQYEEVCEDEDDIIPTKPKPIVVKVGAGDILYLPSLWFHQVSQSHGCIAVNYWYDMKFDIKYAYYCMLEHLCSGVADVSVV